MAGANVDPHDKMRARDVNRVARGEQAPRPVHEHGIVSKAPPPTSTDPKPKAKDEDEDEEGGVLADAKFTNQMRNCCVRYYEFYRCVQENDKDAPECEKFAVCYRALCPYEWIQKWYEEREQGTFPVPL